MTRRVWLLVEWVEENNMIPSYGVVNVDTASFKDSDLQPGKNFFLSLKLNESRLAKIIRIAEKKSEVQNHKEFLERQDQQVKNVLQLCMRTIKEMKSEQFPGFSNESMQNSKSQQSKLPHIIPAYNENSASDNDSDSSQLVQHSRIKHLQTKKQEANGLSNKSVRTPVVNQRRRSFISSTPLPGNRALENIKLCLDQGTQTDNDSQHPSLAKIEEMEAVLLQLHGRFQGLLTKVNNPNVSIDLLEPTEHNDVSYMAPMPIYNEAWIPNNTGLIEYPTVQNASDNNNIDNADDNLPQLTNDKNDEVQENVKPAGDLLVKIENPMRVRRMSAQTTETIPIGDGKALVPERVFNDIDWRSYTTATRQLLQAIFPRKVLATHSLTGKPSPAHLHKPPKKLLDPMLVNDIVKTVSMRCGVPRNLVRNSISVKCTDEAKMYRNRQRHRPLQNELQNEENVAPTTTPSSDESVQLAS